MKTDTEPWSWEAYEQYLHREWPRALADRGNQEAELQAFLQKHPCLLPGGEASVNSIGGHHGPYPGAVITQPALRGAWTRTPDFLWPTKVSGVFRPVLLELERASKRWFRDDGQQTEELSQAINQVAEWRTWFDSETNQLQFYERFGISDWIRAYHKVEARFQLIYGRRSEFIHDPKQTRHRESLRPDWLSWSTYDRLTPDAGARNWVTVKIIRDRWTVIAIPPTFRFGHSWKNHLQGLSGLGTAISQNELISAARKEVLLDELSGLDLKPAAPPNMWAAALRDLDEP